MTATDSTTPPVRRYAPADLEPAEWDQLEPLYRALLDRELPTGEAIERWLADYSELSAVVGEFGSRLNINHACHTDDEDIEKAYLHWVENIQPKLAPLGNQLKEHYLDAPGLTACINASPTSSAESSTTQPASSEATSGKWHPFVITGTQPTAKASVIATLKPSCRLGRQKQVASTNAAYLARP
ncbi:MAG: hypothetical protein AAF800_01480 [Planctomycetota bacterium]